MTVTHTDNLVKIDGVNGFHPGEYASSVHGCWARILQSLGESLTYDDLICYNAFAFRVELHEQMCPSAGHPCCGFSCVNDNVLPWVNQCFSNFPWDGAKADQAAFAAEACAAIKASIDRGTPVQYSSEEDGLIIGYADEGRRWWCVHPYHKCGSEAFWHDEAAGFAGGKWPWCIGVWTEPKPADQRIPQRDLLFGALRQAVEMWKTEQREAYYCGETAYAHWLQWLREVEAGKIEDPRGAMQGNGWCYDVLIHNRRIAARWLRQQAESYPDIAPYLRAASEHYAQIVDVCMEEMNCPWDLTQRPDTFAQWTSRLRLEQIARLEAACTLDAAAIGEIANALQVAGMTKG